MNKSSYVPILVVFICAVLSVSILPLINKKKKHGDINYLALWNPAEKIFLENSKREAKYSGEHIPVIETNNVCELGKLTALSFIHWVKDNPQGVISLPTGKTPELFIEYLKYYKEHWDEPKVARDLKYHGINLDRFPETKNLKFVQLDEFYPMDTAQKNSFTSYIKTHYLTLLEIPSENVLIMDLCNSGILKEKGHKQIFPNGRVDMTLLGREPNNALEVNQKQAVIEAQNFCNHYENKIKEWGGIGFFLGGIGPDGHIAFNMQGSPLDSKTRLVQLNYPSAAAAAGDLGGIEFSRDKTAITIGLETITSNKDATVIIIAAGEAKAPIVANAIQNIKNREYPATALQDLRGTRLYLTKGAACQLRARQIEDIQKKKWNQFTTEDVDGIVIELALLEGKRIIDLTKDDFLVHPKSASLMRKFEGNTRDLLNEVRNRLIAKIEKGLNLPKNTTVLHTGPHHDDVELSYYPVMKHLLKANQNYFVYLTSGFNSVTNNYMLKTLERIPDHSLGSYSPEILNHDYAFILRRYINAANSKDPQSMERTESIIMLKNICRIYDLKDLAGLKEKVMWLRDEYFPNKVPGEKDIVEVQILKGAMRESETERMLLMAGISLPKIHHLRAKFYNGDYFNPMPTIDKDALPLLDLYNKMQPKIISVAFDPEGTGPDTHYKVLQVVAEAIRMGNFGQDLKVWGYRNVWHRFKFSEATLMAPITDDDMSNMNYAFLTCFSTQKAASFPASNYDGPFSELAEQIQRGQYAQMKTLLGEGYFLNHPNPAIRNASGFIFIKEMGKDEFLKNAKELKNRIELI
jgi:glucosamine-6-phosphate deaminase